MYQQRNRGQSVPDFGESELEAWTLVLDAIEGGTDVDDLNPWVRGQLAMYYETAATRIGIWPQEIPDERINPPRPTSVRVIAQDEGEICCLIATPTRAIFEVERAGIVTIDELDRLDKEAELADVPRIGPRLLRGTHLALETHGASVVAPSAADDRFGGDVEVGR